MTEVPKIMRILLVEDNPDDIAITKRALKEAKMLNQLWVVRDGREALDFLERKGRYQDPEASPRPGLILLDINLPKMNGIEVLSKIKESPALRAIPTVMLTVSKRDEDVVKCYSGGCNSFIQKPVEFEGFIALIKQLGLYWGFLNIEPKT